MSTCTKQIKLYLFNRTRPKTSQKPAK